MTISSRCFDQCLWKMFAVADGPGPAVGLAPAAAASRCPTARLGWDGVDIFGCFEGVKKYLVSFHEKKTGNDFGLYFLVWLFFLLEYLAETNRVAGYHLQVNCSATSQGIIRTYVQYVICIYYCIFLYNVYDLITYDKCTISFQLDFLEAVELCILLSTSYSGPTSGHCIQCCHERMWEDGHVETRTSDQLCWQFFHFSPHQTSNDVNLYVSVGELGCLCRFNSEPACQALEQYGFVCFVPYIVGWSMTSIVHVVHTHL